MIKIFEEDLTFGQKRDTDKFKKYITGLQDILFLDEAPPPDNCGCELYKKAFFK